MAERAQIVVSGIVQGVGFRPYVYNLAGALGLTGYVTNTSEGVFIDIEGEKVPEFVRRLRNEAPPLSRVTDVAVAPLPVHGYSDFTIHQSVDQARATLFTLVSPDVSICDDCLRELLDPSDRRYLYPFVNCTNCGPRYSITRSVPYDRPNTTMASFTMCPDCQREYDGPANRRFHAQPNACAACGPAVEFRARSSPQAGQAPFGVKGAAAIGETIKLLKQGGIVAIKGLGGFHIACDAANDDAVRRLREKKRKSNKPFAVMSPDVRNIEGFCFVSDGERELLQSNRRPIVLLRKKNDDALSGSVSPNNNYLGCMLPYTPLHYLLFHHPLESGGVLNGPHFKALVMTSGNLSEEPIVRDNDEAMQKLAHIVDGFLVHDRDIFMRVDDSVIRLRNADCTLHSRGALVNAGINGMRNESPGILSQSEISFLRRSRGYAPDPIELHDEGPEVLACGADLKNTFTLTKGKFAIPSQHIGDMENYETIRFFEESLENLKQVYRVNPAAIVHDLHTGYLSTQWAANYSAIRNPQSEIKRYAIQHHYAHIGSVMAEHGLKQKVIGVAFDGTGYGTDGNLWGGEFLIADIDGFERAGHFCYVALPGGEAAIKEPWKTAVSYIMAAAGDDVWKYLELIGFTKRYTRAAIEQLMIIGNVREFSPLASGAGRLFDAVSAIMGICDRNTFEGEAAMALESFTKEGIEDEYQVEFKEETGYIVIDFSPAVMGIISDLGNDAARELIATKFHNTVASAVRAMVGQLREQHGIEDVALSGGAFQNLYLSRTVIRLLSRDGMKVYVNQKVPTNDACISLGQAYLVRERLKKCRG